MALNHYTQITEFIKQLAESDPLVNKITQGLADEIAFDKMVLFPLVHLFVGNFTLAQNGSTVLWDVQIGAMQRRDTNKTVNTDTYYKNNNEVDNFNETSAILIRLVSRLIAEFESKKITVSEMSPAEKLAEDFGEDLDGYIMGLTLEIPNTDISLCQYPLA
jgi:hypothetical protein